MTAREFRGRRQLEYRFESTHDPAAGWTNMLPSEALKINRSEILALAAKAGAMNVRVFGSAARGDDREDSDLDLLVDWGPEASLFDVGGLIADLQDLLGMRVDVISPEQLHPRFRPRVLAQARPV